MALATKCPHCNTIFRVAADQLKLRGGIVRCGACHEVFDGNAALVEPAAKPTPVIPDVPVEPAPASALAHPAQPADAGYVLGAPVDFELDLTADSAPSPGEPPASGEPEITLPAAPAVWRSAAAMPAVEQAPEPAAQPSPEDVALATVARVFAAATSHEAAPKGKVLPWEDERTPAVSPADIASPADADAAMTHPDAPAAGADEAAAHAGQAAAGADEAAAGAGAAMPHADEAAAGPSAPTAHADHAAAGADEAAAGAGAAMPHADEAAAGPSATAAHAGQAAAGAGEAAAGAGAAETQADEAAAGARATAAHADQAAAGAGEAAAGAGAAMPHADEAAAGPSAPTAHADHAAAGADEAVAGAGAAVPHEDEAAAGASAIAAHADETAAQRGEPAAESGEFVAGFDAAAAGHDEVMAAPVEPVAAPDAANEASPASDFIPAFLRATPAAPQPDSRIEPTFDSPQEHIVAAALDDAHHFEDLPSAEQTAGEHPAEEEVRDETALHAVAAVNADVPDDGESLPDDEPDTEPASARRERALKRAQARLEAGEATGDANGDKADETAGAEPGEAASDEADEAAGARTSASAAARMRALAGVDDAAEDLNHSDLSFVKRVERSQKYGKAVTLTMAIGIPLLLAGLVLQTATTFRDTLAASYPQLKPVLAAICQPLGCKIALPTQLDALSIEPGELASMTENTFSYSTVLRNQSKTVQAWPHIELTLNDNADKPLLRRVFAPRDYLPSAAEAGKGFGPRSEQSIKLYFELKELKASGYHIAIFHP